MLTSLREDRSARRIASDRLDRLGLSGAALTWVSAGSTSSVYRGSGVVVTVASPDHPPRWADERVALAGLLAASGACVRAAAGTDNPVVLEGRPVLLWEEVATLPTRRPDPEALGRALRAWHEVGAKAARAAVATLPDHDDLGDVRREIARSHERGLLTDPAARLLTTVADRLADELAVVGSRMPGAPGGLVHGDLHGGNVLPAVDGTVVLCDLDEVGTGHPDHDLSRVVDVARPLVVGDDDRRAFERGYGGPLPAAARARTLDRLAHLRRTLALVGEPEPGVRGRWFRRLRLRSWAAMTADWSLDLHPVVTQTRSAQLRRVLLPAPALPSRTAVSP